MKKFRLPRRLKKWFKKHIKPGGIMYSTWKKNCFIITRDKKNKVHIQFNPIYFEPKRINLEELRLALKLEARLGRIANFGPQI